MLTGNLGKVESVKIITLLDDYAGYETSFYAQHGIALLIEVHSRGNTKRILLDAGQDSKPILHNMKILGIEPDSIDAIFLSHCHYDHTQGLVGMLEAIGREIPVIGHPDIFRDNYIFDPFIRNIGITEENSLEAIKSAGGQLFLTGEPFEIMPGVVSTGEIIRTVDFEKQGIGTYNLIDGKISGDRITDDLSIVVNVENRGLVVAVGCSHGGIINIIKHAQNITGIGKVAAVMGGFHLIEAKEERIQGTSEALKEMDIDQVVAGHCTGLMASANIAQSLGNSFSQLHVGKTIEIA